MSIKESIAEMKAEFEKLEADPALKRKLARLHNAATRGMIENQSDLGLSEDDLIALGGGTNK